jgi:hypothetical protein
MSLELVASRRRRITARTRWIRRAGVLAVVALVCLPFVAAAKPRHDPTPARSSAAAGAVYGGVTPQEFGVMVEVNRSGRRIARMATGLALDCATGPGIAIPDGWSGLRVSKSGKFSQSFGPETQRDADGTSVEIEGSVAGKFNKSRSSVSGTWTFKVSFLDAAGAVTDTCDSGTVSWRARQ